MTQKPRIAVYFCAIKECWGCHSQKLVTTGHEWVCYISSHNRSALEKFPRGDAITVRQDPLRCSRSHIEFGANGAIILSDCNFGGDKLDLCETRTVLIFLECIWQLREQRLTPTPFALSTRFAHLPHSFHLYFRSVLPWLPRKTERTGREIYQQCINTTKIYHWPKSIQRITLPLVKFRQLQV